MTAKACGFSTSQSRISPPRGRPAPGAHDRRRRRRAGRRPSADRLADQPRQQDVLDEGADLVLADPVQRGAADPDDLGHRAAPMGWVCEPLAEPQRHLRGEEALADDLLGEEVLRDEVLQAPTELGLALGDQRGVRDRDAQRVPEERRHREPVGQRAHHRGTRGGVDIAPRPVRLRPQGDQVHGRGRDEQAQRDEPHPLEAGAARGIRRRRLEEAHRPILRPAGLGYATPCRVGAGRVRVGARRFRVGAGRVRAGGYSGSGRRPPRRSVTKGGKSTV